MIRKNDTFKVLKVSFFDLRKNFKKTIDNAVYL